MKMLIYAQLLILLGCYCTYQYAQQLEHKSECTIERITSSGCDVDGYVGSEILYEDNLVRIWVSNQSKPFILNKDPLRCISCYFKQNFTLAPGEMTSLHKLVTHT